MISEFEMVARLALAGFLAGVIGLERESRHRAAGLRTHILVSMGSALIMLISIYGFAGPGSRDPARLAAQVVSGIGFLGAGTIMREGASIRGLTTAASLWVVAGIGLGAGAGFYLGSVTATVLAATTLLYLNRVERRVFPFRVEGYAVMYSGRSTGLADAENRLDTAGIKVKRTDLEYNPLRDTTTVNFTLVVPVAVGQGRVIDVLASDASVLQAKVDE